MRILKAIAFLATLLAVVPAFAGVVYVPFASSLQIGGVQHRTWIWASNHNTGIDGLVEHLFIPTAADGTADRDFIEPTQVWIGVGQSTVIQVPRDRGMLEILASPDVYIHARLVAVGENPQSGQGIALPVISSDNLVPANQDAHLLGLERRDDGAAAFSSFGLVNLGHQSAECGVSAFRDDGQVVVEDVILTFAPLSQNQFDHVLGILGQTEGSNWRLSVRCDQPFFPYSGIFFGETGSVVLFGPAESGKSQLERPAP